MASPQTVLAFDFGLRRIGVAVGQDVTGSASPLATVANRDTGIDHQAIAALISEWAPSCLVVGMPAHQDGSPTTLVEPIEAFIADLAQYGLEVATVDERHTSIEAERVLKAARGQGSRGRITKEAIDSAAAVFIAERYLSSR